ncbi:DMT family transporter [Lacibacterium aquatile]|uniref:DMT family transporter n=1 Tax=Lacibacterium aquatile TaxID=1168082 RepID=A0ABW5DSV9_9PROT
MSTAMSAPSKPEQIVLGVTLMTGAAFLFTVMDFMIKELAARDYHTWQIVFVRSLFALIPVAVVMVRSGGGWVLLKTKHPLFQLMRGILGLSSMFCFFYAYKLLPVTTVMSLGFSAALFMTAFSVVFAGEKVGFHRWTAVIVGFGGVLYMLQPGSETFAIEALWGLGGAITYALVSIFIRKMAGAESSLTIVIYFTGLTTLASAVFLPFVGRMPDSMMDAGLMVGTGLLGGCAQMLMTRAFTTAPVAVVAPFDYTAMVWAVLIELFLYAAIPAPHILTGSVVVIASGLYILHREGFRRRQASGA